MTNQLSTILTLAISIATAATMGFADPRYPNDLASIRDTKILGQLRGMTDEHLHTVCSAFPSQCHALTALRDIADEKPGVALPDCILAYERQIVVIEDVFEACSDHAKFRLRYRLLPIEIKYLKFLMDGKQGMLMRRSPCHVYKVAVGSHIALMGCYEH